jgi:hypothetical protein
MRLVGRHQRRYVTSPAARGSLKLHSARGKRQRNLESMVSMNSRRFTREANPEAATSPEQDAPGRS